MGIGRVGWVGRAEGAAACAQQLSPDPTVSKSRPGAAPGPGPPRVPEKRPQPASSFRLALPGPDFPRGPAGDRGVLQVWLRPEHRAMSGAVPRSVGRPPEPSREQFLIPQLLGWGLRTPDEWWAGPNPGWAQEGRAGWAPRPGFCKSPAFGVGFPRQRGGVLPEEASGTQGPPPRPQDLLKRPGLGREGRMTCGTRKELCRGGRAGTLGRSLAGQGPCRWTRGS